jgi:hypothetical protein
MEKSACRTLSCVGRTPLRGTLISLPLSFPPVILTPEYYPFGSDCATSAIYIHTIIRVLARFTPSNCKDDLFFLEFHPFIPHYAQETDRKGAESTHGLVQEK